MADFTYINVCIFELNDKRDERLEILVRRTKEEALATRHKLLDAAEFLFQAQGVSRTSLNDIALQAGTSRGAIYWHFEDKAALYNALMDRFSAPCQQAVSGVDTTLYPDAMAALRALAWTPIELVLNDERARRLFTIAMHRVEFNEDLGAIWERHMSKGSEFIAMLERGLQAAQAQGLCAPELPLRPVALGLFALIDGLLTYATLDPSRVAELRTAGVALDAYLAGLRTPKPSR